jgi:hypothetical protein
VKALLITAGLFFSVYAGGLAYFAFTGTGHEYDLKFILPIDTRKIPKIGPIPQIVSHEPDESANPIIDGHAEAGIPPRPAGAPVRFPDRDGVASEAPVLQ